MAASQISGRAQAASAVVYESISVVDPRTHGQESGSGGSSQLGTLSSKFSKATKKRLLKARYHYGTGSQSETRLRPIRIRSSRKSNHGLYWGLTSARRKTGRDRRYGLVWTLHSATYRTSRTRTRRTFRFHHRRQARRKWATRCGRLPVYLGEVGGTSRQGQSISSAFPIRSARVHD